MLIKNMQIKKMKYLLCGPMFGFGQCRSAGTNTLCQNKIKHTRHLISWHIVHDKIKDNKANKKLTLAAGGVGNSKLVVSFNASLLFIRHTLLLCLVPLLLEHLILLQISSLYVDFLNLYSHQDPFFLTSWVYTGPLLLLRVQVVMLGFYPLSLTGHCVYNWSICFLVPLDSIVLIHIIL